MPPRNYTSSSKYYQFILCWCINLISYREKVSEEKKSFKAKIKDLNNRLLEQE